MTRKKATNVVTPKASKVHKRQLSTPTAANNITPGTRSSKRTKTQEQTARTNGKATPTKSKYFDGSDSEADEATAASEDEPIESAYEDDELSVDEPSEPESETDDYDSEADDRQKKRVKRTSHGKTSSNGVAIVDRNDLWKEGVKTGLGPGKQVFIAKPKPRSDGGIKYTPDKIHPNTMLFLADLKKNNDREWLKLHDPDYRTSWKDWESFVEAMTEKLVEVDDTIPELPPKDLVFRIYRDVRFSKDPTPYKPHFSAAWSRTGRKGPYAHYYVQIQPGGRSFAGCGLWHPEAHPLSLLRRSIDRHPERLRAVLTNSEIRKKLLGGVGNDEKKAIKAFANQNAENALKSKPKGFDAGHPSIELLRLRNFTMGKRLTDEEVANPQVAQTITELFKAMLPFITFLNSVVMPDDGEDDDDDSGDSDSDGADNNEDEDDDDDPA